MKIRIDIKSQIWLTQSTRKGKYDNYQKFTLKDIIQTAENKTLKEARGGETLYLRRKRIRMTEFSSETM